MDNSQVILGNCLDVLKTLADNSIDAVVTDPPYGLKFMAKRWDYSVPSVETWQEVLRVLKPGGHALVACGTRTQHRMVVNLEDAGFEVRDIITWLYGSGFPKSHNIKDGAFKGWGTALKPACEFWTLLRKPLEGTVAQNIAKYGTGGINIDVCRVGTETRQNAQKDTRAWHGNNWSGKPQQSNGEIKTVQGRWPANVIFDEEAAAMLDEQSGPCKTGGKNINTDCGNSLFGKREVKGIMNTDNGVGASRFFYCAKASKNERNAGLEGMPKKQYLHDGRPNPVDVPHQRGQSQSQNHHPTVKPIKLMEYLIKLITPPAGVVLDPFVGSGTTGIAAAKLGHAFIGIELEPEYAEIAIKRIEAAKKEVA